ncbi:MAG: hypothetical protein BM562_01050 [Alphaproteobacteria bacterium MedPE-SWcel]|nr:MAG: hypothetical protein BM562_01050 [Alphaproteobacteria bacterium MedPE-SWcel]
MSGAKANPPGFIRRLEETLIVFLLGGMTLLKFANVIARYVFNSNILWALELTVYLFAWLVLLGAAYALATAFFHAYTHRTLSEAGKLTVTLLFGVANALIINHVLMDEQVPLHIVNAMLSAGFDPVMFLILITYIPWLSTVLPIVIMGPEIMTS